MTIDLETGKFRQWLEVKQDLASQAPYGEWLKKLRSRVERMPFDAEAAAAQGDVENQRDVTQMTAFGWSLEDLEMQVSDMSNGGKETLFSMGNDIALAVLSESPQPLYDYFKQRFAQVTNPPIDPLREGIVMGVEMTLGKRRDLLAAPAEALAEFLTLDSPVLNGAELGEKRAQLLRVASRRQVDKDAGGRGDRPPVRRLVLIDQDQTGCEMRRAQSLQHDRAAGGAVADHENGAAVPTRRI